MKSLQTVTSHDVARRAGVSRAVVSGVLNGAMGTMRVSEETRQRVLEAAAELGYVPHPVARALRRRRTDVIGFVPRSSRTTPYEQPVPFLLGIHIARAAMKRGYHVFEASAETTETHGSAELIKVLLDHRVDGIILDSPETEQEVRRFVDSGLPVVQVIRPQTNISTPSIVVDAAPGIEAAVHHLIELGHRDIAFIGRGSEHPIDRVRLDCFTATLERSLLPARGGWVQLVDDYGIAEGQVAMRAILALVDRPTALFAAGDNLALGALQALYEHDVRVPDHMSLVSYDDIFAAHLSPPLTSVIQPLEDVADLAVASITSQLDAGMSRTAAEAAIVSVPAGLTLRGSTRSPPLGKEAPVTAGT